MEEEKNITQFEIVKKYISNKINITFHLESGIPMLPKNMTSKELNRINKWILQYCYLFRIKSISSVRVISKQKNNIFYIEWLFTNTRNDIFIHKCITKYINHILKKYDVYVSSSQRNNRGYFILTIS